MIPSNIIVNADDFGRLSEVNEAIRLSFEKGLINRTTIMVNMPFFEEACSIAKTNHFSDKVGLHLNLTEGMPLTMLIRRVNTLCKEDGSFRGDIFSITRSRCFTKVEKCAIIEEIKAQTSKYFEAGFTLAHLDSHHHVHVELPVFQLVKPFIANNFNSIRIGRNMFEPRLSEIPKYLYKLLSNSYIASSVEHTKLFGSYNDYCNYSKKSSTTIEVMVHPIIKDDKIMDRVESQCYDFMTYKYEQ